MKQELMREIAKYSHPNPSGLTSEELADADRFLVIYQLLERLLEGYAIVPIEPTDEMIRKYQKTLRHFDYFPSMKKAEKVYKAMLSAIDSKESNDE